MSGFSDADKKAFGNGEVGGDRNWGSPAYANTGDGQDVTFAFGEGSREGDIDIASGHLEAQDYYSRGGHDHFGPNGEPHADRGAYRD